MRAQEILTNPVWEQTFKDLSEYYYAEWRHNPDFGTRERISMAHDMLDDFQTQLEATMAEGKVVPLKIIGGNDG